MSGIYLKFDGVDDYLLTPTFAFNRIVVELEFPYNPLGSNYLMSLNSRDLHSSYLTLNDASGRFYDRLFWNDVDIDDRGDFYIPYGERGVLDVTLSGSGNAGVFFFAFEGNFSSPGILYNVKIYNGVTLMLHYDMSTGAVQDRSGNNRHGTLRGGTWVDPSEIPPGVEVTKEYRLSHAIYADKILSKSAKQELYKSILNNFLANQSIVSRLATNYSINQAIYNTLISNYLIAQNMFNDDSLNASTKQNIFNDTETNLSIKQNIFKDFTGLYDMLAKVHKGVTNSNSLMQMIYKSIANSSSLKQKFKTFVEQLTSANQLIFTYKQSSPDTSQMIYDDIEMLFDMTQITHKDIMANYDMLQELYSIGVIRTNHYAMLVEINDSILKLYNLKQEVNRLTEVDISLKQLINKFRVREHALDQIIYAARESIASLNQLTYYKYTYNYSIKQATYKEYTNLFDTLQELYDKGRILVSDYALSIAIHKGITNNFDTKQMLTEVNTIYASLKHQLTKTDTLSTDTKQIIIKQLKEKYSTFIQLFSHKTVNYDTLVKLRDDLFSLIGIIYLEARRELNIQVAAIRELDIQAQAVRELDAEVLAEQTTHIEVNAERDLYVHLKGGLSMAAIGQDFAMFSGESKYVKFTIDDVDDLTNSTLRWAVKQSNHSGKEVLIKTSPSGITIDGKEARINLKPEDTDNLSGIYHHECSLIDELGNHSIVFTGKLTIAKSILHKYTN